ncbi:MAG: phosphodiesterase [Propionibacterium sp.]|nr:phosphodiesterase [Propionibacterium sp.]
MHSPPLNPGTGSHARLRAQIEACGYFPDLVEEAVHMAVGDEQIIDFVVHHEPTFNRDEIHRHLTILVQTPTRLIIGHTDEATDEATGTLQAATSTEAVPLTKLGAVALTRVVTRPDEYRPGDKTVSETWLSVGWGTARRVDLEPATCGDPTCDADHGYSGLSVSDDLTVRMSVAADGEESVAQLVAFAGRLQRVAGVDR